MVVHGPARFTILTDRLIRMEWSPTGAFEDRASFAFINRNLPVPRFTAEGVPGAPLTIRTGALTLRYDPAADPSGEGRIAHPKALSIELDVGGKKVTWTPASAPAGNLGGTTRTLDGVDGACELEPGLLSRDGWALVDDSRRLLLDPLAASGDASSIPWATARSHPEALDWYFFGHGHDYAGALADFTLVAGSIPLPPRYVLGSWWSRYWAYSDDELKDIVQQFDDHGVPLDVLVIDMDWHLDGWTGYTWNKDYFPDHKAFLAWCRERGLRTTLNLHPADGVGKHEEMFARFKAAMGITARTCYRVPFDCTDRLFVDNYFKLLHHPHEEAGIDFWWMDWQQGMNTKIEGLDPLYWLNYLHWVDMERRGGSALRADSSGCTSVRGADPRGKRPLIFSRWGGLGNHRYQIGFSGDTYNTWKSLAFQPHFTATAANVGYGYWSHDIGGHQPGPVAPELYARWIQFGAFSPVLRTHCGKRPDAERRIWAFPPEVFGVCKAAFLLRSALTPYTYTACRRAHDTGISLCHPLYYRWPEAEAAYTHPNQYMFGDDIMVAPVVTPAHPASGISAASVWLPPAEHGWVEWPTGRTLEGGTAAQLGYALDEIPLFVRAGAVIPMQPPALRSEKARKDLLILNFFGASAPAGGAEVYDDDGISQGYQNGEFTRTSIEHALDRGVRTITVHPAQGDFAGAPLARAYELRLHGVTPPRSVTIGDAPLERLRASGDEAGWWFDSRTLTTVIRTRSVSTRESVTIKVALDHADGSNLSAGLLGQLNTVDAIAALLGDATPASVREFAALRAGMGSDSAATLARATSLQAGWWGMVQDINRCGVTPELKTRALARIMGLSCAVTLAGGADGRSIDAGAEITFASRFGAAHGARVGMDFEVSPGWRLSDSTGARESDGGVFHARAALRPTAELNLGTLDAKVTIREASTEFSLSNHEVFCPSIGGWWVLGPFDAPGEDKLAQAYIGEEKPIDLAKTHTGRGGKKLAWKRWTRRLEPGADPRREFFVDFHQVFGEHNDDAAAYALCRLENTTGAALKARIALGSDDGSAAWLNGVEVFRKYVQRAYAPKEDLIDVTLRPGSNELLLKVGQAKGAWGFCVHLEDAHGRPLAGVRLTDSPAPASPPRP